MLLVLALVLVQEELELFERAEDTQIIDETYYLLQYLMMQQVCVETTDCLQVPERGGGASIFSELFVFERGWISG